MSLVHEEDPWIAVFVRDTGSWVSLSIFTRGVSLEISRKVNSRGEIKVGKVGLPALGPLLACSWGDIAGHVETLLALGYLEFDAERGVVRDPQHVARQTAARRQIIGSAMQLAKDIGEPERKALSNAERARNRRVRMKAQQLELPAATPTLTLPIVTPTRVATVATRVARDDRDAPPESGVISAASAPDLTEHLVTPEISLSLCVSSDLSDLKISKRGGGVTRARGVVRPDAPLPAAERAALEAASSAAAMELNAEFVWRKFASHANRKRWRADDLCDRWENWIGREIEFMRRSRPPPIPAERAGPCLVELQAVDVPPSWWQGACESAAMVLGGEVGDRGARWAEYLGSRHRKTWATNHTDAVGWLSNVVRSERRAEQRMAPKRGHVQSAENRGWSLPEGLR